MFEIPLAVAFWGSASVLALGVRQDINRMFLSFK
jgi:hypothetical protein